MSLIDGNIVGASSTKGFIKGTPPFVTGDIPKFNDTTGTLVDSGIPASALSGGPFLPLTGGTLTGNLVINNTTGNTTGLVLDYNGTEMGRIYGIIGGGSHAMLFNVGTDYNFAVQPPISLGAGISFASVNNANTANEPIEFRASEYSFWANPVSMDSDLTVGGNATLNNNGSGTVTIGNAGIASNNPSTLTVNGTASCWYQFTIFDDLGITSSQFSQGEGGDLSITAAYNMYLSAGGGTITTGSGTTLDDGSGNMTVDNTLFVPVGYLNVGNPGNASISLYNSSGVLGGQIQANTYGAGIDFYTTGSIQFAGGYIVMDASGDITATTGTGLITCNSIAVVNNISTTGNLTMTGGGGGTGIITAKVLATNGGLSTQFLKGDGTLDSNTYLPYKAQGGAVLSSGTKAITISGLTALNRAFVQLVTPGGTLGAAYKAVCTTNTLTITSVTVAGVTVTTDTSTLNYVVF